MESNATFIRSNRTIKLVSISFIYLIFTIIILPNNFKFKNNNKVLYIKLFGAKQEINFRIESTNSEIYYLNSQLRPSKILSQQHLNCGNSFYYIGSYSVLAEDTSYYLEEIYGKYNLYYRMLYQIMKMIIF